jgi:hypothetical protein
MPIRGTRSAPRTFKGKYTAIERFLDHLDRLFLQHGVTSNSDKCKSILEYCSHNVRDFIQSCEHSHQGKEDWTRLRNELLKYYDAEKSTTRYRPSDLIEFVKKSRHASFHNLGQWKKYYLKYASIAGLLLAKRRLTEIEYAGYFWQGLPTDLKTIFEAKLAAKVPAHDLSQPYPVSEVCAVAESHFKRDKFTDMLLHISRPDSDSDPESDSDSDDADSESSDSSDSEYESRHRKKKKKDLKKKKKRHSSKTLESKPKPEPTQKYKGTEEEVEGMISKLNNMNLNDREYGPMYYRVLQLDKSGIAAKCISRQPRQVSNAPPPFASTPSSPPSS